MTSSEHIRDDRRGAGAPRRWSGSEDRSVRAMTEIRYREAVRAAMTEEMERDGRVYLVGEEVGHYQGAYKVSEGMLAKFGEKRIIDAAHHRERLHRHLDRCGDGRAPADRRVHDVELLGRRLRSDPEQRGEDSADVGRAVLGADRPARAERLGAPSRLAALTHAMEHLLRARARAQGARAGDPGRTRRVSSRRRSATTTRCSSWRARRSTA